MTRAKVHCAIVIPSYNEAPSLPLLHERLAKVLDGEGLDWEAIVVDDGSSDDSYEVLREIHRSDARFKCLRFSRNFGSHVAITAGLQHAAGDVAIVTTADLQEPPELIPSFLAKWREGYQIVWGIRQARTERGFASLAAHLYHRLFGWLTARGRAPEEIGGGFFLADRQVLDALNRFSERNRNIIGLLQWAGFRQGRVYYEPAARQFGRSKWLLSKKVKLALDSFVAFSFRPIRIILGTGVVFALGGLLALLAALAAGALTRGPLSTVVLLLGGALLFTGIQLAAMGLLGEYLWRALDEARARPLYIVMDRLGWEDLDRPDDT